MSLPGLTDADDPNVEIKAPTLNTTKVAFTGASIVGLVTPILAFVTDQDPAVQQMALMITLVAIPSAAFVVGVDMIARAYATKSAATTEPDTTPAAGAPQSAGAISMSPRDLRVKVSGSGDEPFHVLAIRWNPDTRKWTYLLGRKDQLEWFDESKVDQYVPG